MVGRVSVCRVHAATTPRWSWCPAMCTKMQCVPQLHSLSPTGRSPVNPSSPSPSPRPRPHTTVITTSIADRKLALQVRGKKRSQKRLLVIKENLTAVNLLPEKTISAHRVVPHSWPKMTRRKAVRNTRDTTTIIDTGKTSGLRTSLVSHRLRSQR